MRLKFINVSCLPGYIKSVALLTFITYENPQNQLFLENMVTNVYLLNPGYSNRVILIEIDNCSSM